MRADTEYRMFILYTSFALFRLICKILYRHSFNDIFYWVRSIKEFCEDVFSKIELCLTISFHFIIFLQGVRIIGGKDANIENYPYQVR